MDRKVEIRKLGEEEEIYKLSFKLSLIKVDVCKLGRNVEI